MIYTVTLNPSIDYTVEAEGFKSGALNRTGNEYYLPGGKGINVSSVLHSLGCESVILGFVGGFTGIELKRLIAEAGLKEDLIDIKDGNTRINVKVCSDDETEINGRGPVVGSGESDALFKKIDILSSGDVLIMSGSAARGLPNTIYADILSRVNGRDIMTAVDASGELLGNALPCHPFVIKPNSEELQELTGIVIRTPEDAIQGARKLQSMGAANVLVSLGGEGAVLVTEDGREYKVSAPHGKVINSVGAGDSLLAGFIYKYMESGDCRAALKFGVAVGSASAFSGRLATREDILRLQ